MEGGACLAGAWLSPFCSVYACCWGSCGTASCRGDIPRRKCHKGYIIQDLPIRGGFYPRGH
jgi:hypothetical protein